MKKKDCKIEDLGLNFTFPGYDYIELKKDGSKTVVNINNLEEYISLLVTFYLQSTVEV